MDINNNGFVPKKQKIRIKTTLGNKICAFEKIFHHKSAIGNTRPRKINNIINRRDKHNNKNNGVKKNH